MLDMFGVERYKCYSIACAAEDLMRREMYSGELMYESLHYNLTPLSDQFLSTFPMTCSERSNFLFDRRDVSIQKLAGAKSRLDDMIPVLKLGNVFLAGGAVVSSLTNTKINDYDLFMG